MNESTNNSNPGNGSGLPPRNRLGNLGEGGAPPDAGEMLTAVLGTLDLVKRTLVAEAAVRDEIVRRLPEWEDGRNLLINQASALRQQMHTDLSAVSAQLRAQYAPAAVSQAVVNTRGVLDDFRRAAADAVGILGDETKSAARMVWRRVLGTTSVVVVVGIIVTAGVVSASLRFVPSLDKVKERRAELAQEPVHPIEYEGSQWVRIEQVQRFCQNGGDHGCAQYGRIQK